MSRSRLLLLCAIAVTLSLTSVSWSQENATITGTVLDSTGSVVPNVNITLTNPATGQVRQAVSNSAGSYLFANVGVGNFTLEASAAGFRKFSRTDIVVNVAQALKEDVTLSVGSEGETVTVQANALQVQTETNEVSNLISGAQVSQLATNGRNVTSLAALGMGKSNTLSDFGGVNALTASNSISFNGTRPSHNIYLLDGGELNDRGCGGCFSSLPSIDALAEFQTLDSNYGPDYGIGSGGTILMVVKSGAHDFHGALWEFNRNEDYAANNYFLNQSGKARPKFRLNTPGGNFGGPLWIPHIYNDSRKRTFFFVNEEWRRLIIGSAPTVTNTIPDSNFPVAGQDLNYLVTALRSGLPAVPIVPATQDPAKLTQYASLGLVAGQPFPNNCAATLPCNATIPNQLFDPNAVLELNAGTFPHPNVPGANQYIASISQPTNVREDLVRIDHAITSKYQLMGHYIHDQVTQTYFPPLWGNSSYPTVGTAMLNPSWAAVIKLTQSLSPSLLNETAFNYSGNLIHLDPVGVSKQPAGWSATTFFPAASNLGSRMPEIQLQGTPLNTTWSSSYFPWKNSFNGYQVRDDLSWTRGRHQFKFGFSYFRTVKNQQLQANTQGTAIFNNSTFSQDSYVNLLLGDVATFNQLDFLAGKHWVNNNYGFYGNDNWHVNSRLTLNLGLRYDGLPHAFERFDKFANFVPANYNASLGYPLNADGTVKTSALTSFNGKSFYLNGISEAGVKGFPRGNVNNKYNTVQPRVGFAYDISGNGKTVIRGGVGLFFERVQGNDVYNAALNPPFAYQPSATNVYFSNPETSAITGITSSQAFPSSLTNLQYSYYPPGTSMFSLGVQRQLAQSVVAVVQYVGTTGWHQSDDRNINTLPLGDLADRQLVANGANPNLYRQFPGYASITQEENSTNSSYNSAQAGIRMENRHGLTLQLAYTFSHQLDYVSFDLNSVANPFSLYYNYGSGGLDRRHIFNANYIYSFPFFAHSSNALARSTVGGWQFSGVTIAQSGVPVNVSYSGKDTLGLGGGSNRPNVVGPIHYPKTVNAWFDKSAFAAPVGPWDGGGNQGFGTARKDTIVGPGRLNFNMSLFKTVTFKAEGPRLELRFESFNTFNHTQFNGLDSSFTDGNFGHVTTAFDPRVLQLGAKLQF